MRREKVFDSFFCQDKTKKNYFLWNKGFFIQAKSFVTPIMWHRTEKNHLLGLPSTLLVLHTFPEYSLLFELLDFMSGVLYWTQAWPSQWQSRSLLLLRYFRSENECLLNPLIRPSLCELEQIRTTFLRILAGKLCAIYQYTLCTFYNMNTDTRRCVIIFFFFSPNHCSGLVSTAWDKAGLFMIHYLDTRRFKVLYRATEIH